MIRNLIFILIGLACGAAMVGASHSVWHQLGDENTAELGGRQTDEHSHQSTDAAQDPSGMVRESMEPEANTPLDQSAPTSGLAKRDTDQPEGLPPDLSAQVSIDSQGRKISDVYAAMVAPKPRSERLTTQEMYKGFEDDFRDESWAYPMEIGINQYIAERGGKFGAAFEYVECRSRYCTIAGVVHGGGQEIVNEFMAEMTQSGWWQTYGGRSTVGSRHDTEYRFVSIIPRAEEDTSRGESAAQSIQKGAGGTVQSADG